jgi:hypothetical protein
LNGARRGRSFVVMSNKARKLRTVAVRLDRTMFEEVRAVSAKPDRGLSAAVRKLIGIGLKEHHRRLGIDGPARESWDR